MLLLFAKRPRPPGGRENTLRKTIQRIFRIPIIPFGALVDHRRISTRDQMRIHRFGKKVLPGIFLGCALIAVKIWKGDILIADIEKLENLDASEIIFEGLTRRKSSLLNRNHFEEKITKIFWENQKGRHHHLKTQFRMPVKHETISGPFGEMSFTAITLNRESNCTRREKIHSLFQ